VHSHCRKRGGASTHNAEARAADEESYSEQFLAGLTEALGLQQQRQQNEMISRGGLQCAVKGIIGVSQVQF
jgi:hypothetical protein